jgi:hypothetical protein
LETVCCRFSAIAVVLSQPNESVPPGLWQSLDCETGLPESSKPRRRSAVGQGGNPGWRDTLVQMSEYLQDHRRVLDAGDDLDRAATLAGSARYLQAIPMQPLCIACHGSELSTEVSDALAQRYPQDEATGFAVGELRGAFLIEWPADGAGN